MLLVLGCFTVLGLMFVAGVFAGRQWPQVLPSIGARAEREARRDARPVPRKLPEPPPVLTFYQELTAPLTAPPPRSKPAKSVDPAPAPAANQALQKIGETDGAAASVTRPPTDQGGHAAPATTVPPVTANRYTVQVGAFKTREQAEAVRARLAAGGHDAYVADFDGPVGARYRVRVGTFASRDEARQVAERLATERFATYVTAR
jgi:DedD protein